MGAERLDALVLRWPENVLLLSGFWPMIGASVLLFPREGNPVCVVPHCYEGEAGRSLEDVEAVYYRYGVLGAPDPASALMRELARASRGRGWRRVGYDGDFGSVAPSWNSAEVIAPGAAALDVLRSVFDVGELLDVSRLVHSQRAVKTPREIEMLRTANEIACFGFEAFERAADAGARGVEIAAEVEKAVMTRGTGHRGAFRVRGYAQVATGARESAVGYRPNEVSTLRRLERGDIALLELAVVADGYWADRTRARAAGEPTEEQLRVFGVVGEAQRAALAAIRPGASGAEADEAARAVVRDAGYGERFPHITGHGVGFAYHEAAPRLAPGWSRPLERGMVTTVEPGVYFEPMGGIRVEDDAVVTDSGCEVLGPRESSLR
jgi:Xaa-Pro aminopeptidase